MSADLAAPGHRAAGLVEILDRVLDKGLVIAGDIQVSLADIELLTIRIRLIICSLDKAEELGIDWWRRDRYLSGGPVAQRRTSLKGLKAQQVSKKTSRSLPTQPVAARGDAGRVKSRRGWHAGR